MAGVVEYGPRQVIKEELFAPGHRACVGCGEALAVRLVAKAVGENVIIANATGCMEIVATQFPWTSWRVPWIHALFENTAAVASGVEAALKVLVRKGIRPDKKTNIIAIAGDGGTSDIGLQALSGALERGHKFTYICFDNEAYMNTGIQRSSATPFGAATTTAPAGKRSIGQVTWKKNMPAIVAAHDVPYVATGCPAYPFDLMDKMQKALAADGPAYLHVLSPCPTGWRVPPEMSIEIGRLAVQSRVFPLYEIENGRYKLSHEKIPPRPVADYLKPQGRFRHLTEPDIKVIQDRVDKEFLRLVEKANCERTGIS